LATLKSYQADGLLLLTAMIWGFAFVAQRSGMAVIGPLAYSGVRFVLGTLILVPVWRLLRHQAIKTGQTRLSRSLTPGQRWLNISIAGVILFIGANLQQIGLVYTTAANAGFITCFYVVLVPIVGIFIGHPASWRVWLGAILALIGLYILSVGGGFVISPGDVLVLIGAFVWTAHILVINRLASRMDALEIAVGQFAVCAVLSLGAALIFEPHPFDGVAAAAIPILYGGIFSIGVAFTLQIVAQKSAHPARASIIMSMEALFAGIGGVLILGEPLTLRLLAGGLAMLAGMILAQLEPAQAKPSSINKS
jgi:drug/metabolite transporter (DMT)-like permease